MSKKDRLFEKIESLGFPENEIVVSLEDFFEGNNDYGSIGVNLYPHQPSPSDFYKKFKEIKELGSVDDILVRISDTNDGDWAYTDTVFILTSLPEEKVKNLVKDLMPDEIFEGWGDIKPTNAPNLISGFFVYSIWWD